MAFSSFERRFLAFWALLELSEEGFPMAFSSFERRFLAFWALLELSEEGFPWPALEKTVPKKGDFGHFCSPTGVLGVPSDRPEPSSADSCPHFVLFKK